MLKFRPFIKGLLLVLGLLGSVGAAAQTVRYVSDQLIITMRQGPGDQTPSVRTLVTGTALEILEEQGAFVRVRTPVGEEGWVRSQYLVDTPVARTALKEVSDKLTRYESENKVLRQELSQLKQGNKTLQQQAEELGKENRRLSEESVRIGQVASRPLELERENRQLKQESAVMKDELAKLKSEYGSIKKSAEQRWFLAGGGVLLLGIILGLLLPRLRVRRQSEWA